MTTGKSFDPAGFSSKVRLVAIRVGKNLACKPLRSGDVHAARRRRPFVSAKPVVALVERRPIEIATQSRSSSR